MTGAVNNGTTQIDMKAEKVMTAIVRFAGWIAFLFAAGGVYDVGTYLWRQRDDLNNVGGVQNKLVLIGILLLIGTVLCLYKERIGPWLCSDPGRKKRVRPSQNTGGTEKDADA